jgi:amino acid transporter
VSLTGLYAVQLPSLAHLPGGAFVAVATDPPRAVDAESPRGAVLNVVLLRSLGRFDLVMMSIAAVISVDTIGTVAAGGGTAFVAMLALVVLFLVPYGMVFAELTSTFTEEGGPYIWVRLAFGRLPAAIAVFFYWVTNPIWLGGSLAALAAATFSAFLVDVGGSSVMTWVVQAVFIWTAITVAVISLRRGKYVIAIGAIAKLALVIVFTATTVVYALRHGVQPLAPEFFSPTLAGFLGVAPILLFALSGFEAASGAAEEMRAPARDMPVSIARSGFVAAAVYLLPVLAVFAVIPAAEITGIDGFMAAIGRVFTVYGPAADVMTGLAAATIILVLLTQGAAWMVATDRMQAVAGADGAFPAYFGKFSPRFGTPTRVNMASGAVATAFMTAALVILSRDDGDVGSLFMVVLLIATSTLLISYLIIVPALPVLRHRYPAPARPYRVPFGTSGAWLVSMVVLSWIILGTIVAVAPGLLEGLLGIDYDFIGIWGLDQARVETFTLGTLGVLAATAVAGYAFARARTRRAVAER